MADMLNILRSESVKARFWSKVDIRSPAQCWEWRAFRTSKGYGRMKVGGVMVLAHRISLALKIGKWPSNGEFSCHTCDNRACVNPNHLYLGNALTNAADTSSRERWQGWCGARQGEGNPKARLTKDDVQLIRASVGRPYSSIGKDFGVSGSTVRDILTGRTWRSAA